MPHPKAPEWTEDEIEVLRTVYVDQGLVAAMKLLPGRNDGSIHQKAHKLGLKTTAQRFPLGSFMEIAEEAWHLRHEEKLSYASIGAELGVCEANATNAVLYAGCKRAGHRPIERSPGGKLLPEGRERLRLMFRKGWTHRKIQEWTGAPASMCSRERRRYAKELKAKGLAPLPAIGGGERYSGAKIAPAVKREVERLYLEGFGTAKITKMTGVSNTHCLRTRDRLIKRLKRQGKCLPGCDENGVRRVMREHSRRIPESSIAKFKKYIRDGETVARAARLAVIGRSSADKIVHQMIADGFVLRTKPWRGRDRQAKQLQSTQDIPGGRWGIDRYRAAIHAGKTHLQAVNEVRRDWEAKIAAERAEFAERHAQQKKDRKPLSFEEQLAAVERGGKLVPAFRPTRPAPDMTLGGVATGAL
jgi:transposase